MADEEHLALLMQGVEVWNTWREQHPDIRPNLASTILSNADLAGANLSDADLTRAILTNADLTDADLTDADLSDADLTRAILTNADLTNADLTRTILRGAILTYADLRGANLTRAVLTRAVLRGAVLTNMYLTGAILIDADLTGANLTNADLTTGANLTDANLTGANLTGANLTGANLTGANLHHAVLRGADLHRADLHRVDLTRANLHRADLTRANLSNTNLTDADLDRADLTDADLSNANLTDANLSGANLSNAVLTDADLSMVFLSAAVFGNTNLTRAKGLETCSYSGPSTIDHRTLQNSGPLPLAFLRGVGLPENLIDYLPSLLNQPIQFFSCFISYSSKDQKFADRLHADLQNKGVRCWFAPHDMPIGAKIIDAIDEAIRLRDKVLLILSEHSVDSRWVEGEVTRSLDEEDVRNQVVLFPVRIDDTVMATTKPWARLLRGQRNIGDFTRWKDHDAYQKVLEKLLRDLKVAQAEP